MAFRVPVVVAASSISIHTQSLCPAIQSFLRRCPRCDTSSASQRRMRPSRPMFAPRDTGKRRYATIQSPDANSSEKQFPPWPKSSHPTPYEILGIPKDAVYSKRAYYQLAKLYHPDTNSSANDNHHPSSSKNLPDASTRLERYHILVAAHELLSDPAKRRLYDSTGFGWSHTHKAPSLREMDRNWRNQPGSAANNATWEDWQRWHAAREGRAPEPVYMSNGMFASMVVALCMIGWLAQISRVESTGDQYMAYVSEQNAHIGSKLMREGVEATGRTRDQRVDNFLKDRENTLYQYEPARYDREEEPETREKRI